MYQSRNAGLGRRNRNFGGAGFSPKRYGSGRSTSNHQKSRRPRGEHIEISKFIQRSVPANSTQNYRAKNTFADFRFCRELQNNLDKRKYISPTPIQDQAIKAVLEGRDLIGLADTGTGKTAVFLLPMIQKISMTKYEKVLIIAPTRELAIQIDSEFRLFANGMRIYSSVCVGGTPMGRQIANLRQNPNVVIGTPGRLKDLSNRGLIKFNTFQNIVLDEVDRMLDMGFVNEITDILNVLPQNRQALFFSATLPAKIKLLVDQFLNDPILVEVKTGATAANVLQDVVRFGASAAKFDKLKNLLTRPELRKVLIFSETKREVEKLAVNLSQNGHRAESIHGDKRQNQREKSLTAFRNDQCKILVATDVAARGLDIGDISHVINYTVPQTYNDYIHRIGRTGRGTKIGQALTFVE
ncbi:MAG: DEAD/DEAH box helicase [Candidatus Berkelbacteria bacterium]|nr:DEAD/DEAH box helicase [Candidatus Berkelbacteria bacterium]